MSDSLQLHRLQLARLLCPSLSLEISSNSCPLSRWCYLTISSSATLFSSCPQSFPASGSYHSFEFQKAYHIWTFPSTPCFIFSLGFMFSSWIHNVAYSCSSFISRQNNSTLCKWIELSILFPIAFCLLPRFCVFVLPLWTLLLWKFSYAFVPHVA